MIVERRWLFFPDGDRSPIEIAVDQLKILCYLEMVIELCTDVAASISRLLLLRTIVDDANRIISNTVTSWELTMIRF